MSYRQWLASMIILDAKELIASDGAAAADVIAGGFLSKKLRVAALVTMKRDLRRELNRVRANARLYHELYSPRFEPMRVREPRNDNGG